jgi:hypothetical protein
LSKLQQILLVDGAPEPVLSACNADDNLVHMPFVSRCWKTSADLVGKALPELQRPLPHGFVADQDASGGEHLLDHAHVSVPQAQDKRASLFKDDWHERVNE